MIFLNIDDELNMKSMHSMIFSRLGLQVACCSTGAELAALFAAAHAFLRRDRARAQVVVLLDHVLDGTSGLQVVADSRPHLRRLGLGVKWLLLSSTEDQDTVAQYLQAGIEYVIQKPLSVAKIKNVISK